MSRRLVITADDLGREHASAAAIAELAADGAITATTAIVVAPAAEEGVAAVTAAGVVPHLHATLSSDGGTTPWHPLTGRRSLVTDAGTLPDAPTEVGERAEPADVAAELDAQLAWLHARGIRPAALDSHSGTLYGLTGRSFLGEAFALAARHGMGFRLPRDPALYLGGELPNELRELHATAVVAADAAGIALPASIATNRRPATDLGDYETLRAHYLRLLGALPEGTSELFLHPAPEHAVAGPNGIIRAWELRLLRDDVFRGALDAEGFELVAEW